MVKPSLVHFASSVETVKLWVHTFGFSEFVEIVELTGGFDGADTTDETEETSLSTDSVETT